jgi:hypothetical protein
MDEETCQGVRRNFREALQALALPAPEQIRVTVPGCVTCELYEDFVSNYSPFLQCYEATLSDIQKQQLRVASETLEAMPSESFVCFDESVLEHRSWAEIREVAASALFELGWSLEAPEEYVEFQPGAWQRPPT